MPLPPSALFASVCLLVRNLAGMFISILCCAGVCVDKDWALKKLHRCLHAMTSLRDVRLTGPNTPTGDALVAAALSLNRFTCLRILSANLDARKLPEMRPSLYRNAHAIYTLQLGLSNHTFMQQPALLRPAGHDNDFLESKGGPVLCGCPKPLEEGRWNSQESCEVIRNLPQLRELILMQWPPWQWRDALTLTHAANRLLTKLELYIAFPDLPHLNNLVHLQHLRLSVGGGGGKGWLVQAAHRGGNRGRGRATQLPPAELGESMPRVPFSERFGNISDWPFKTHLRTLHLQLANGFMTKAAALARDAPDSPTSPGRRSQRWANKVVFGELCESSPTSPPAADDEPTLGYRIASQLSQLVQLTALHLSGLPKYHSSTRNPSKDFSAALCHSLAGMPQLQHLVVEPHCPAQQLNNALRRAQNLTHLDLALQPSVDPSLPVLECLENLVVRSRMHCSCFAGNAALLIKVP